VATIADPSFQFNADPDPAPRQSDENLRPPVYKPSRAPFGASKAPDPDPAFDFNADSDPTFQNNADPQPGSDNFFRCMTPLLCLSK